MTRTISGTNVYPQIPDGALQRPYNGFYGKATVVVDETTIVLQTDYRLTGDVVDTTIGGALTSDVKLTPALNSQSAAMHVVGGDFMAVVQENLIKAQVRRFF